MRDNIMNEKFIHVGAKSATLYKNHIFKNFIKLTRTKAPKDPNS